MIVIFKNNNYLASNKKKTLSSITKIDKYFETKKYISRWLVENNNGKVDWIKSSLHFLLIKRKINKSKLEKMPGWQSE